MDKVGVRSTVSTFSGARTHMHVAGLGDLLTQVTRLQKVLILGLMEGGHLVAEVALVFYDLYSRTAIIRSFFSAILDF